MNVGRIRILLARGLGFAVAAALFCIFLPRSVRNACASDIAPLVFVTNCSDDVNQTGSLRNVVANAPNGAVVDLSRLLCGPIVLASGAIDVKQQRLSILGAQTGTPTSIVGGTQSGAAFDRLFVHDGLDQLELTSLALSHGAIQNPTALGGCVITNANLVLDQVTLTDCTATATGHSAVNIAAGGATYSGGSTLMGNSYVKQATAQLQTPSKFQHALGGGVYAQGGLQMIQSRISLSRAVNGADFPSSGGGAFSDGNVDVRQTTIDNNDATTAAGLASQFGSAPTTANIVNSTFSDNFAFKEAGALQVQGQLTMSNCTVGFNHAADRAGGVDALSVASLTNTILFGNTAVNDAQDFFNGPSSTGSLNGKGNLIGVSNVVVPSDTIRLDPLLHGLANNGGFAPTLALDIRSPAIDRGISVLTDVDQRDLRRKVGDQVDIGAYEMGAGPRDARIFASHFQTH